MNILDRKNHLWGQSFILPEHREGLRKLRKEEAGTFVKTGIQRRDAGQVSPGYFSNTVDNIIRKFKERNPF